MANQKDYQNFEQELSQILVGNYNIEKGIALSVDTDYEKIHTEAAHFHEWIHSELTDNSAYGHFQRLLMWGRQAIDVAPWSQYFSEAFTRSMRPIFIVHEGLASYRSLVHYLHKDKRDAAQSYLKKLPRSYREALNLVLQVLPDPREIDFGLYDIVTLHAICVHLGVAVLNSPILPHYMDMEALQIQPLKYIDTDTPDERLCRMLDSPTPLRKLIQTLMDELPSKILPAAEAHDTARLMDIMDESIIAIRNCIPDIEFLTVKERNTQASQMKELWARKSEEILNRPIQRGKPREVTNERTLNIRFQHLNANTGEHPISGLPCHDVVDAKQFRQVIEANQSENLIWVSLLSLVPSDINLDTMGRDCVAGTISVLANIAWPSAASPLASTSSVALISTIEEIANESAALIAAGGVIWYMNWYHHYLIHKSDVALSGLIIERCESAGELFEVIAQYPAANMPSHFGMYSWHDMHIYALISNDRFWFTVGLPHQRNIFRETAERQGLVADSGQELSVGKGSVSTQTLARIALWMFVGK